MALTSQTQNFISNLQNFAEKQLALQVEGQQLIALWNLNGIAAQLNQDDLDAISSFKHLTPQEIIDGVVAATAIDTAMGDYVSGQASNFLKLRG